MMHLITAALGTPKKPLEAIVLRVDRHKLARRRWRACAADGVDFGFDVPEALHHGDCIFKGETKAYYIEQEPEACLLVEFSTSEASETVAEEVSVEDALENAEATDESIPNNNEAQASSQTLRDKFAAAFSRENILA